MKIIFIFQFPLPHSRGSSHGQSRGIRTAYKEPFLAAMMADAFQQWKNLENESGVHLFKYSSYSLNGNPSNGNNPLNGNFFNLPNGLLHKTRGFWKLFVQ